LQCVAVCCSVLQCVAVCCSVLQCVAVCCSVLQCVAVCCRASHTHDSSFCHLYMSHIHIRHVPLRVYSYEWVMSHTRYSCVISHNRCIWVTSPCGSIDWFWFPIFCTNWDVRDDHKLFTRDHQINHRAVPVKVEIHKGAILVHIAPLWFIQHNNANHSLRMDGSCHIPNTCVMSHRRYIWVTSLCECVAYGWVMSHNRYTGVLSRRRYAQVTSPSEYIRRNESCHIPDTHASCHTVDTYESRPPVDPLHMDVSCQTTGTHGSFHAVDTHKSRPPPSLFL